MEPIHTPPPVPTPPAPRVESPRFEGDGAEYFGIWIVNLLLTVVTLGFYLPWARVRTRRYFHENTRLFDAPFDYLADPSRILLGYLIVGGLYLLYTTSSVFLPVLAILVFLGILAAVPWFVYKAHRFKAANSAYRNVPFRFTGLLGDAYVNYLALPFASVFTLGLLWPFVFFKQKEYFFNNFKYGHLQSQFRGQSSYFYKVYLIGFALLFGTGLALAVTIGAIGSVLGTARGVTGVGIPEIFGVLAVLGFYAGFFAFAFVAKALIQNHCWRHTTLQDRVQFDSFLHPGRYLWIQLSNLVAIACTLGLFAPWAKVRLHRYVCACLAVGLDPEVDLEALTGQAYENITAVGESATEFLDIDFGF